MMYAFFKSQEKLAGFRKVLAGFLLVALNLSIGGLGSMLLSSELVYAAGAPVRVFSASILPGTVVASTTQTYTITVANSASSNKDIKSATIAKPTGWTNPAALTLGGDAASGYDVSYSTINSRIQISKNSGSGSGIQPGHSFTVTFSATSPASVGSGVFAVRAFENNSFSSGNGAEFTQSGDEPGVVVNLPTYLLTISKTGTGTGSVTSAPAGVSCGVDCTESYTSGTPVTLTATADAGSTFTGWSGACSGTGTCAVTMDAVKSVTATFALDTHALDVSLSGTGGGTVTSNPAGIDCGSDCTENYNYGTEVTLTPTPAAGSTFDGWSGACSGSGVCTFIMNAARTVGAMFNLIPEPGTDLCSNIDGVQLVVPNGTEVVNGECLPIVTPPTDVCPNIDGDQASVPEGLEIVAGQCVAIHTPSATVVTTKIICDSETDLPDWSGTDHPIDVNTATSYVETHPACHIAPDWKFQWAPMNEANPGDMTGEASGWNTFVSSTVIPLGNMVSVWVREVFDSAYIPFTGTADEDKVSAELYCNGDALHYDNLDEAALTDGGTEYCVAFNAPKTIVPPPTPEPTCQIEGYKYDAENHPVAGLVIGAETATSTDGESLVKGKIIVTKTDEAGHYCLNGVSTGTARVFEWPASGTENDHVIADDATVTPRINSFFDVFPEIAIHMGTPEQQPAQVNSFFDVFTEINGAAPQKIDSFFDIFTDLNIADAQKPIDSFFDVFTEVNLDKEQNTHHTVNFYNKPIAVVTDVCPNLPGMQETLPESYRIIEGNCYVVSTGGHPAEENPGAVGLGFIGGGNNPGGLVLGASTTTDEGLPPNCTAYLGDYLRMGMKNNPAQVTLLQTFLNTNLNLHLPVTGYFGPMTHNAVKQFQVENADQVLAPWAPYGLTKQTPTGYVYKTTKRWINLLECKTLDIPMPQLP